MKRDRRLWSAPRSWSLLAVAAISAAAIFAPAAPSQASSCCSPTPTGSPGRLLRWETAVLGLRTTWSKGHGYWNADGEWEHLDTSAESDLRVEWWSVLRLTSRSSFALSVPFVHNWRSAGELSESGGRLSDIGASWRHEFLTPGERERVPAVALSLGVLAPTGRPTHAAQSVLGADVTGRGAWQQSMGLALEWNPTPWFIRTDLGAAYRFAFKFDDGKRQRFGPEWSVGVLAGSEIVEGVTIAASVALSGEAAIHIDAEPIDNSATRGLTWGLSGAWRAHRNWALHVSTQTGVFIDGLGDNRPGAFSLSGGVRYAFTRRASAN